MYNVRPKALEKKANIVVAQGFLSGSDRYQNEYFELRNSLGQIIQTKTVKGESLISVELEESGVYFIRIETSKKQVITKKLVVYK